MLRIAIDGPSGAGKSTLARNLAEHLALPYIDTGAMYRAIGFLSLSEGLERPDAVVARLDALDLAVRADPSGFRVLLDGTDVTDELRAPAVSTRASLVAQNPAVRSWLVERQRALAGDGAVLEGRDIGTEVLPDADLKFFVTADEEVRMARRAAQLGPTDGAVIAEEIRERDRRDKERTTSPLRVPDGAIVIDTGAETVEESFQRVLTAVRGAHKSR